MMMDVGAGGADRLGDVTETESVMAAKDVERPRRLHDPLSHIPRLLLSGPRREGGHFDSGAGRYRAKADRSAGTRSVFSQEKAPVSGSGSRPKWP